MLSLNFKKKSAPNHGFTLIEAMVVVAIVGILAYVAVASLMNAMTIQKTKTAGLVVANNLNAATTLVKQTRLPASVSIKGNKITVYKGVKTCTTSVAVYSTDTTPTPIKLSGLPGSLVVNATGAGLTPIGGSPSGGGWVTNPLCITFGVGKIGNSVDSTGWLTLRDSTNSNYGVAVMKTSADDRFQVWLSNNGSWLRVSP